MKSWAMAGSCRNPSSTGRPLGSAFLSSPFLDPSSCTGAVQGRAGVLLPAPCLPPVPVIHFSLGFQYPAQRGPDLLRRFCGVISAC